LNRRKERESEKIERWNGEESGDEAIQ